MVEDRSRVPDPHAAARINERIRQEMVERAHNFDQKAYANMYVQRQNAVNERKRAAEARKDSSGA